MDPTRRSHKNIPNPPIFDIENVASTTECTGLIPAAIETEDEAVTYARLYAIHLQKPKRKPNE